MRNTHHTGAAGGANPEMSTVVANRRDSYEDTQYLGSPEPTFQGGGTPGNYSQADDNMSQHPRHHHRQQDENEKQNKSILEKLDKRFSHMVNIETSVADSGDFPIHW